MLQNDVSQLCTIATLNGWLLHNGHLTNLRETSGLQAIKVHATADSIAVLVRTIPGYSMLANRLIARYQSTQTFAL